MRTTIKILKALGHLALVLVTFTISLVSLAIGVWQGVLYENEAGHGWFAILGLSLFVISFTLWTTIVDGEFYSMVRRIFK